MKAKSLRRGGMARLFHGAADSVLTLEAECLRLDGDGTPSVIALRDLVRLASMRAGQELRGNGGRQLLDVVRR